MSDLARADLRQALQKARTSQKTEQPPKPAVESPSKPLSEAQQQQLAETSKLSRKVGQLLALNVVQAWRLAEATKLSREAAQLLKKGKLREAIPPAQEAVQKMSKALGKAHPDYAPPSTTWVSCTYR